MLSLSKPQKKNTIRKALSLSISRKRVSFPSPFCSERSKRKLQASMTVEACLVLPLFLFFMATLLYSLEIIRFQSDVWEGIHQTLSQSGFEAYAEQYGKASEEASGKTEDREANQLQNSVYDYLNSQFAPFLCVEGGEGGIRTEVCYDSYSRGDILLSVAYTVKPFIGWLPLGKEGQGLQFRDSGLIHGFVGYTGGRETENINGEETFVYITPSGTKYHASENCSYLKVTLLSIRAEETEEIRNNSGEKYTPCTLCRPKGKGLCYYTEWGNKYHGSADCPALKRTIYIIPLSQVSGRTACSKCT